MQLPQPFSRTHSHSLFLTTVIYTAVIKCTAGARWRENTNNKQKQKQRKTKTNPPLHSQQIGDHSRLSADCDILSSETKGQTFRGTPGFYSTNGVLDYTAVIFSAHLVAVKCEGFTTTSIREIQPCARPATQLTRSLLLPANRVRQSIAHAQKFK